MREQHVLNARASGTSIPHRLLGIADGGATADRRRRGQSVFARQPETAEELMMAWRAPALSHGFGSHRGARRCARLGYFKRWRKASFGSVTMPSPHGAPRSGDPSKTLHPKRALLPQDVLRRVVDPSTLADVRPRAGRRRHPLRARLSAADRRSCRAPRARAFDARVNTVK